MISLGKFKFREDWYLALIVTVGVFVGLLIADDYGPSPDEYLHIEYAEQTIETYAGLRAPSNTINNLRYYGPAFNVATELATNWMNRLINTWDAIQARHFVYYLSFVMIGVPAFYSLTRRYVSSKGALVGTLVFLAQPLYFGHAFLNPKDLPFMSLFIAAVSAGFYASDYLFGDEIPSSPSSRERLDGQRVEFDRYHVRSRGNSFWIALIASLLILVSLAYILVATQYLEDLAIGWIKSSYFREASNISVAIFRFFAEDADSAAVSVYIHKFDQLFFWLRPLLLIIATMPLLIVIDYFFDLRTRLANIEQLKGWTVLIMGGVLLGIVTSIRVPGPFAGVLVSAYLLWRARERSIKFLAIYWLTAGLVTIVTWPWLWENPIIGFIDSARLALGFSAGIRLLYRGEFFDGAQLPWHWLPVLIGLQFTVVSLVLATFGLFRFLNRRSTHSKMKVELLLILIWIIVPLLIQIVLSVPQYDNFRHLLFITPPIFIFASLSIGWIFIKLENRFFQTALAVLFVAPGIAAIVDLHPYEYVYYNDLINGVYGATGRYDLDYMCISTYEALQYVNETVPPNSWVAVRRMNRLLPGLAREDLHIYIVRSDAEVVERSGHFVLNCTRHGYSTEFLENVGALWGLEKFGSPWVILKRVP